MLPLILLHSTKKSFVFWRREKNKNKDKEKVALGTLWRYKGLAGEEEHEKQSLKKKEKSAKQARLWKLKRVKLDTKTNTVRKSDFPVSTEKFRKTFQTVHFCSRCCFSSVRIAPNISGQNWIPCPDSCTRELFLREVSSDSFFLVLTLNMSASPLLSKLVFSWRPPGDPPAGGEFELSGRDAAPPPPSVSDSTTLTVKLALATPAEFWAEQKNEPSSSGRIAKITNSETNCNERLEQCQFSNGANINRRHFEFCKPHNFLPPTSHSQCF